MNKTRAGGLAAGMLAVGALVGSAGTAVARDGAPPTDCPAAMAEHMSGQGMAGHLSSQGMAGMMSMMGGSMMDGTGPSTGPDMMDPDASSMSGSQHELHHPAAAPEASK